MRECELEGGAPRIGQRLPVMDHHGHLRADVEVTRVAVMPFDEIDEAVVTAESAGARSVAEWRGQQRPSTTAAVTRSRCSSASPAGA